jgi:hypothetical protein
MSQLSLAQKDILRLVRSFNGLYGPLAIEAAMSALSRVPETDWRPIVNHIDALVSKGLVRFDQLNGRPRFLLTEAGERALDG